MNDVIILIPPSEGKQAGGTGPALKKVSSTVKTIITQLADQHQNWEKILGVKGKTLEQARHANQNILSFSTMPAVERYSGVVYIAIDYPSFDEKAKAFFNRHVRIVSAVFGLVKPTDLIPDYKLKIEKLGADKHWRPHNGKELKGCFVIDLLPQTHKKAVVYDDGVAVDFVVVKNGKAIPAGHQGKHIKGRFIRWLCQNQCVDTKLFKKFNEDGFRWNGKGFKKEK
ncbi:MAG: YaaA family protein [Candidatus Omnitrophica bacterium]|nr:YaaA family protein [Candidatus Omnitrophota bacterium]MCB9747525.1 YaaA family protein [Candidatus Omnitrophota bacterium]